MLKLAISLLPFICLWGPQDPLRKDVKYDEPTRFELLADKSTYCVAEPVDLTVTIYNDRDRLIKGDFDLGLMFKQLQMHYCKVGGEFVRYFPRWLQIIGMGDFFTLPTEIGAHGKHESRERLFYNTYFKRFVLAEPGEYEFKATFQLQQFSIACTVMVTGGAFWSRIIQIDPIH
jgi:hypothetical protein